MRTGSVTFWFTEFRFDLWAEIFHPTSKNQLVSLLWLAECRQIAALISCMWNMKMKLYQLQRTNPGQRRHRAVSPFGPTVRESEPDQIQKHKERRNSVSQQTIHPCSFSLNQWFHSVTSSPIDLFILLLMVCYYYCYSLCCYRRL